MSETSTIRADSPEHEQSTEGTYTNLLKLLPSLLIPARPEARDPVQHVSTYAAQLPRLQDNQWQIGTGLTDLILAPSDQIITFYNNPSHLFPRAILLDQVLDKQVAAWFWTTFPNTALPSLRNMFHVDKLLTLLTNFTRHDGTTPNRDYAMNVSQAVCIWMLKDFETPTTYRSRKVDQCHFYGLLFALLHHGNHMFQLHDQTNKWGGQQIGRLSAWAFHQDHVMVGIQSLSGELISRRLSWQEAGDLASTSNSFTQLSRREVFAYGSRMDPYTTAEVNMAETSPINGDVAHSDSKPTQIAVVGQLAQGRCGKRAKRSVKKKASGPNRSEAIADAMTLIEFHQGSVRSVALGTV